ncbi:MAG: hypothetical protein OYK82_10860 [Gammaproteobacteria bacterium]|nr:hypothetical protein [Gammaproteobacteria bacterium]
MLAERRAVVLLGGLLAVATAVSLTAVAVPAPHNGGDNAGYLSLAHALVSGEGYAELWDPEVPPHTKYPPGLPLLLGAAMLAGATSWMAFKILTAVTLALAVFVVFAWAAGRAGPLGGVGVAILTLVSGGWLEASRWVLSEPLFLAFTFLALWTVERSGSPDGGGAGRRWLWIAGLAAVLAFFTRSAGLPLVLALGASLLLARRVAGAGALAAGVALPGIPWYLRARTGGAGAYQSEFWMANPYEPDLGTIGWLDLPARVWANLQLYAGSVLPGEWWPGAGAGLSILLGTALLGLAGWGWFAAVRRRSGAAEFFVPLYLGLILLWPEVWSGDRFILPLYPLLLLYAGEAVARSAKQLGAGGRATVSAAAFLLLLLPALPHRVNMARTAAACRQVVAAGDPLLCQGPGLIEFRDAAAWSGASLPEGAVVLTRKPRIFYLFGGPPGRTFPFTRDADRFLADADNAGADYLLLDRIDQVGLAYIPAVIAADPGAFCFVRAWGRAAGGQFGTVLLGIRPPTERTAGEGIDAIGACPAGERADPAGVREADPRTIPRLAGRE